MAPPQTSGDAEPKESVLGKVVAALKPEDSKAKTDGKQSMPTRTWILLAVTVLVTVGWLLWDDAPAETPAAPPDSTAVAPQAGGAPGAEANDEADGTGRGAETAPETGGPTAEGPTETATGGEPDPDTAPDPSPTATATSEANDEGEGDGDEEGPSLERRAADAYIAGRYDEALPLYRELAGRAEDGAFQGMVDILERRVRARCTDGTGPGGEPCDTP